MPSKKGKKTLKPKQKVQTVQIPENVNWQKVKLKGPVITNDTAGLEGLIGLEVLEDYDLKSVLKGGQKLRSPKEIRKEERKLKKEKLTKKKQKENTTDNVEVTKKQLCEFVEEEMAEKEVKGKPKKKQPKKKLKKVADFAEENDESDDEPPTKKVAKSEEEPAAFMESDEDNSDFEFETVKDESDKPLADMQEVEDGWNGLGVPETILKALADKGFTTPTEIQALTLPAAILGKKDILGAAETGSGKTLAFGIPLLAGIMELKRKNISSGIRKPQNVKTTNRNDRDNLTPPPEEIMDAPISDEDLSDLEESSEPPEEDDYKPLYAVILTPTRELAVQVRDHIITAAKYTGINTIAVFGGLSQQKQERMLKKCPEIVVATPGRFWELLQQENSHLSKIDDISFLVIDETDRMVEKGHFEELKLLLNRLNADEIRKQSRQNFVFSATLSMVHDIPDHLQKRNFSRTNKIAKITPGMKIHSLIEDLGISQPKIVDVTSSTRK